MRLAIGQGAPLALGEAPYLAAGAFSGGLALLYPLFLGTEPDDNVRKELSLSLRCARGLASQQW